MRCGDSAAVEKRCRSNVGSWGGSGFIMLALSSSHFGPTRTSAMIPISGFMERRRSNLQSREMPVAFIGAAHISMSRKPRLWAGPCNFCMLARRKAKRGKRMRRVWGAASGLGLAALLLIGASGVCAQDWPTRPIKIVSPLASGGALDAIGHAVGDAFSVATKLPVIL